MFTPNKTEKRHADIPSLRFRISFAKIEYIHLLSKASVGLRRNEYGYPHPFSYEINERTGEVTIW